MSIKIANDTANGSSTLQPSNTATGDVVHTLPAFTTELAPRMQLGTAVASTSGTSIDFTGIPSWAKKVTVMFSGVSTNGTSTIIIQLGDSGGIKNTGYLANGTGTASAAIGNTAQTIGLPIHDSTSATYVLYGNAVVTNVSENIYTFSASVHRTSSGSGFGCGGKTLSGTLDRIRITTVNGTDTFDAGTINILVEG